MNKKLLALAGVAAVSALILSGCSSADGAAGGGGSAATGEPIVVAGRSGLTFFPEAPQAVQAVFDDYNSAGGFNGQPIEYTVYDDKTDPAASATAAKDALDSGAVALSVIARAASVKESRVTAPSIVSRIVMKY